MSVGAKAATHCFALSLKKRRKSIKEMLFIEFFREMEKRNRLSPYKRCKIAELVESGIQIHEVATQYKVTVRTVYQILKERKKSEKKQGRPAQLSPHQHRKLITEIRWDPSKSARALKEKLVISASVCTIQCELKQKSFVHVHKRKTPKISAVAKAKRVAFAKAYLLKKPKWWHRVIFLDKRSGI